MKQAHPLPVQAVFCLTVDDGDLPERRSENALEVVHPVVAVPELFLEGNPRHKGRFAGIHAMQALSKPGVNVEGHGAVRETGDGVLV